jgi:hypothetical protein
MLDLLQSNRIINCMFLKHPEEQNMTYLEHLKHACSYAVKAVGCSIVFIVHGFIPCLFEKTGSAMIKDLNDRLNGSNATKEKIN